MTINNFTFEDYKNRISIIQVAMDLGYSLKSKSGSVTPELALYEGGQKIDEIVIKNPLNSSSQTYFDRKGEKGNLIQFVYNRLDMFCVTSRGWDAVNEILSGYLGAGAVSKKTVDLSHFHSHEAFDLTRYELTPASLNNMSFLRHKRKIKDEILGLFLPYIFLVRDTKSQYNYQNIGFPFRIPGHPEIVNFELRNTNYKGFCTGGIKGEATFTFCLNDTHSDVKYIFFTESTIDLISFIQLNIGEIDLKEWAFVSTGGNVTKKQILNNCREFPSAKPVFGFDDDVKGNIFDILAYSFLEGIDCKCYDVKSGAFVHLEYKEAIHEFPGDEFSSMTFFINHSLLDKYAIWKAEKPYKDFNEMIAE